MGWHPLTAAAVPALGADGSATTVQAALDALAGDAATPTWQAFGERKITVGGPVTAWETTGAAGLTWSNTNGCEVDGALFPLDPAAWWHASAYARLDLWDGDPDAGGNAVTWPDDVRFQLWIGYPDLPFLASPVGWADNSGPGHDVQIVSASGLILAGRDAITDGESTTDVGCDVAGQVYGVTTPDLVVRVMVGIYAAQAAPAAAWGGIA